MSNYINFDDRVTNTLVHSQNYYFTILLLVLYLLSTWHYVCPPTQNAIVKKTAYSNLLNNTSGCLLVYASSIEVLVNDTNHCQAADIEQEPTIADCFDPQNSTAV